LCLIGNGVVLSPAALIEEMGILEAEGVPVKAIQSFYHLRQEYDLRYVRLDNVLPQPPDL
jgi:adenylosuccinate synthase